MSFPYVWQSWSLLALIQGGWHLHSGCEQLCGLIIHVPKGRGEGVHFYTDLIKAQEGWAPKNWCFWTVVLEKTLDGPLDSKETKPVHPKGNQPWIFIGRTDAEAEVPVVGQLIRKDLDAGKDWGHEEKGVTEKEMVGWHHWLNGHDWTNSRRWWRTGKPDILQSMGSQRAGHDWATEKQQQIKSCFIQPEASRLLSQFCLMNTWWMVWGWLPLMWCWGDEIGSSSMKSPGDITPGKSHMGYTATRPRLSRSVQQGNSPITWHDQKLKPECFSGYFCFVFFFS